MNLTFDRILQNQVLYYDITKLGKPSKWSYLEKGIEITSNYETDDAKVRTTH
jgi:hypothetical protein